MPTTHAPSPRRASTAGSAAPLLRVVGRLRPRHLRLRHQPSAAPEWSSSREFAPRHRWKGRVRWRPSSALAAARSLQRQQSSTPRCIARWGRRIRDDSGGAQHCAAAAAAAGECQKATTTPNLAAAAAAVPPHPSRQRQRCRRRRRRRHCCLLTGASARAPAVCTACCCCCCLGPRSAPPLPGSPPSGRWRPRSAAAAS
eukprot:COSAG01_NODE_387_length_17738_cov_14.410171_5_plen_199_part_00